MPDQRKSERWITSATATASSVPRLAESSEISTVFQIARTLASSAKSLAKLLSVSTWVTGTSGDRKEVKARRMIPATGTTTAASSSVAKTAAIGQRKRPRPSIIGRVPLPFTVS